MLIDQLKKLSQADQPQTLDALFQKMKENIAQEVKTALTEEIRRQIGGIKKVRDGVDGKSPDIKEVVKSVISLIPKPIDGVDGKNAVFNKDEIISEVLSKIPQIRTGKRGGGGSTMRVDNLSSQITGSTRNFTTTHKIGSAHLLFYSSAPTLFLPTTDYSVSGNVITLDSSIDFPVVGQSLAIIFESQD